MNPVSVNIFDSVDVIILYELIDHEKSFSNIYSLSQVKSNELSIEAASENKLLASSES